MTTKAWLDDGAEERQVARFRDVLRVIERRARAAQVSVEEYFAGIVTGTYPKVEQSEIDALRHEN
jgi:hypothetical protein